MALTQGLIDSYWRKYNQRRALTGLPSSYQETRGSLDPMLEQAYRTDIEAQQRAQALQNQNRQINIQEDAARNANRAANISGIANLGQLGVTGYLGNKYLGIMGRGATPSAPATAAGVGSTGILQAGVGSGSPPLASAINPATGVPSVTQGLSGIQYGSGFGAPATEGLLSGAASSVAPSALGSIGGDILGRGIARATGMHQKTAGDVGGVLGGAGVGFAVGGPAGAVVGAGLGLLKSLF